MSLVALSCFQVQRVVDTGRVTAVQGAVLEQMRSLGLLLAVDLGLLSGAQVSYPEAATEISTKCKLSIAKTHSSSSSSSEGV